MVTLLVSSIMFAASCSSEPDANERASGDSLKTSAEPPVADQPAGDEESAEPEPKSEDAKASRKEIEAPDAAESGLGPTDTVRAFNDAVIKKDAARIRAFLSRGSIKLLEKSAKEQGRTVNDILTTDEGSPMPVEREMKNEVIEGNNATVEVKNSVLGSYDKMFLVKENGNWRIALDKIEEEMIRKLNELQKNAPKLNG